MYFAFDCLSAEFVYKTTDALQALQAAHFGTPLNIFVLIDGAFDEDFLVRVFGNEAYRVSLYEGTPLSGLGKSSLFLVQIRIDKLSCSSWVARLVGASGNRPMWSIIVASIDINKFAQHLVPFLIAKSDDSLEWPVRWGDTRILPQLLEELGRDFVGDLMEPIYSWIAPSRNGNPLSWSGQGASKYAAKKYDRLPIDEMTFARLVEGAEPDMVLSQIYDRQSESVTSLLPSECHRRVARQLRIANQFNIIQPAVRQHFSMMALFLQEHFVDQPELRTLLENVKNGADYMNEIGKLDGEFWKNATAGYDQN